MIRNDPRGSAGTTASDAADDRRRATRIEIDPLSNPRRRRMLRFLRDEGGTATIDDVAAALPTEDDRAARIRLHHVDLPKLEDVGALEYDVERGRVRLASE